jgi:Ca2+:H+ antiporter
MPNLIVVGLLIFVPLAPVLKYLFGVSPVWVFVTGVVATAVLAEWVKRATEQLANYAGPSIGGLLNVSFGSIAELILALFVLSTGEIGIVRAQITGSILGTSLFGLGLAIMVGGSNRERQRFQRERAGLLSTLLILSVIALLLPAAFDYTARSSDAISDIALSDEELSVCVSVVMLLLYGGNLIYTLITHRDIFARDDEQGEAQWSLLFSIAVLVGGTAAIALQAELISSALMQTAQQIHLSPYFLGIVVLALVGTSADLFAAAYFARQDRMGLVMSICIGSAIQMALVVAPLLVLMSWLFGHPMNLVFSNPLELFALAAVAFIVSAIASDGETTWFEGLLLLGLYTLLGLAFFFVQPS